MPKIYAKHNLIPCGFITAKKPVGRHGTDSTAECVPCAERMAPQRQAALGGVFTLELPQDPAEELTESHSQVHLIPHALYKRLCSASYHPGRGSHGSEATGT